MRHPVIPDDLQRVLTPQDRARCDRFAAQMRQLAGALDAVVTYGDLVRTDRLLETLFNEPEPDTISLGLTT